MKLIGKVLLLLLFTKSQLFAQDPLFSQYYANPVYLNPALVGTANEYRAILVHRRQWSGPIANITTAFSLDKNLGPLSGWGIQVINDNQAGGLLKTTQINGSLAHNIRLSKDTYLGLGLKFGVYQKLLDWSSLTFEDQLDKRLGIVNDTNERFGRDRIFNGDLGAGFLFSSKHLFAGVSVGHINRPEENFTTSSESRLPIKYTLHVGGFIKLKNDRHQSFTVTPNIIYEKSLTFDYWNFGMTFSADKWVAGAMYRAQDAVIISIGSNGDSFKIGYSFDLPIAEFGPTAGNSHEITLAYTFKPNKSQRVANRYKGKCPTFYKKLF